MKGIIPGKSLITSTLFVFLFIQNGYSQLLKKSEGQFSYADTLRGSNGPARAWWDVLHYAISVKPDYIQRSIAGTCLIKMKIIVKDHPDEAQIDLQEPMNLDSVFMDGIKASYRRDGNAFFIKMPSTLDDDAIHQLLCHFSGKPRRALNAPWDGGWIWTKDKKGNPWMSVACQGLGASVWYPCKDIQSDEPDEGALLSITVPDSLVAIGNGRLKNKELFADGFTRYNWEVTNPINNYNIIPYIGKYEVFKEIYDGEKGPLNMEYWVLGYNIDKAKKHFTDAPKMMKAFEYWFGPYPFYEDGYKLVEAPHLGMEHQSAIAYGNDFKNGYMGSDLSGSGWGLKWDFIIVHESGHEWFANNITTKDIADMWVHEGFTNYSETIFTEYYYGKDAGTDYVTGIRKLIKNDKPIIGQYGVNHEGSGDMYYKAGNMIHAIRQVINNDEAFRRLLRGMNKSFYHQTVTGKDVEEYINRESGINFSTVFDQYLRTTNIPILEYKYESGKLLTRWNNTVDGFKMPVRLIIDGRKKSEKWITPNQEWTQVKMPKKRKWTIDRNFLVELRKVN